MPRSGTTLLTALLDNPPESVAIGEPQWQSAWRKANKADAAAFARYLVEDFRNVRDTLIKGEPVRDRFAVDGGPLTNYVRNGARSFKVDDRVVSELRSDFVLSMKWPALYTAALPEIAETGAFRIVALVREPVATIASWNATEFPISRGRLPVGEPLWPELRDTCRSDLPLLEKQIRIWDLFARRYVSLANQLTIVRYEDLVEDPYEATRFLGVPLAGDVPIGRRQVSGSAQDGRSGEVRDHVASISDMAQEFYPLR